MGKEVNILLVEDDQVDIMAVQRAFKQRKIANPLSIANNGIEALEILRGSKLKDPLAPPYIIILDLNMPRMNGLELVRCVSNDKQFKNLLCVILTSIGKGTPKMISEAREIGVKVWLIKPPKPNQIKAVLEKLAK